MNLPQIIEQLESCGFESEAGPLTNNVAFLYLKKIAETNCAFCMEATEYRQKDECRKCKSGKTAVAGRCSK